MQENKSKYFLIKRIRLILLGLAAVGGSIFLIAVLRKLIFQFYTNIGGGTFNITKFQLMNIVAMVILTTISALTCNRLAKNKGRNQFLWILISFFINLWAVIILWFLPNKHEENHII